MKKWIIKWLLKLLWRLADDASMSVELITDHYYHVPANIKKEHFTQWKFDFYETPKRKECLDWLNKE